MRIIDGDSIIAQHRIYNRIIEIRMYGIDAPENKKCKKLLQDEKETHLPAQLLIKLGFLSCNYLRSLLSINTQIGVKKEKNESEDIYKRILSYIYLPNGDCINEIMIKNGYAKPYNKYPCQELANYQQLNTIARLNSKGLYQIVHHF